LINPRLFGGRNLRLALFANFVVGAAMVIAMVDVPIFVNAVEVDLERAAVMSGWVLSVLTASMAITAYVGGRLTERTWYGPPVVAGLVAATVAFASMGFTWDGDPSYLLIAVQLAVLGAGFGLTVAPTNAAVIAGAAPDQRGAAAGLVMVTRLLGFSVGLSALTAWGLARFNSLRGDIDLPPLTDPGFESALREASEDLTAKAIAETFLATAAVTVIGVGAAVTMRRQPDVPDAATHQPPQERPIEQTGVAMSSWLNRHLGLVLGTFALLLVGAFVWIAMLVSQVHDTRKDLDRVEAGAAIFASQVQGFQTKISELAPNVSAGLDEAITGLESFGNSAVEFNVPIDENVQFETDVVIDREIEVPIKTTLPINESFDTTIKVAGPFGIDIPLDVTVPVDIDVPIDLTVTIPIHETIPIDANVPVKLDVPISVDVSETQLAELSKALAAGLKSFKEVLAGLGG
jgi:MFS family permease